MPPAVSSPGTAAAADAGAVCPTLATIYASDAALLERLLPRKELRRTRDLVRLSSERIDDRALALETPWFGTDAANGGSDSDGGEDEEDDADEAGLVESAKFHGSEGSVSGDDDDDDDDGENAGMDDEEDEASANAHTPSALKRKPSSLRQSDPVRPSKKVAFAEITTQSKKQVPLSSNKRTNPPLARGKRQKTAGLSGPSATTANSRVQSTRAHTHKPAANAPTVPAQKRAAGEDGAYDFSKYF